MRITWHSDTHTDEIYTDSYPLADCLQTHLTWACIVRMKSPVPTWQWRVRTGNGVLAMGYTYSEISAKRAANADLRRRCKL